LGRATCAIWFRFQGASLHVILALFELILIVRIFALYGKSRKVGVFLMLAMCTELGVMAFSAVRLHRSLRFDGSCLVLNTPKESLALGFAVVIMQGLLWGMTWYKQVTLPRTSRSHKPVVSVMFRDGLAVFLIISALLICSVFFSMFKYQLSNSVWSIFVTLLSISGCRVIMNMQRLKYRQDVSEIELSTIIHTSFITTGTISSAPMTTEEEAYFDGTEVEFPR
jgi:hypothetical protein